MVKIKMKNKNRMKTIRVNNPTKMKKLMKLKEMIMWLILITKSKTSTLNKKTTPLEKKLPEPFLLLKKPQEKKKNWSLKKKDPKPFHIVNSPMFMTTHKKLDKSVIMLKKIY